MDRGRQKGSFIRLLFDYVSKTILAQIEKYSGARSLDDFKNYVSQKISEDATKDKEAEDGASEFQAVLTLSADNFEHGISNEFVFVKFFAPWFV
jgi:hypothetical protein